MKIKLPRKSFLCRLTIISLVYIFLFADFDNWADTFFYDFKNIQEKPYFVNTTGCRILPLPVMNAKIINYIRRFRVKCRDKSIFRAVTINGRNFLQKNVANDELMLIYNNRNLTEMRCIYTDVARIGDDCNRSVNRTKFQMNETIALFPLKTNAEVIKIVCYNMKTKVLQHDVHFFEQSKHYKSGKLKKQTKSKRKPRQLSVMILGFDSMSHLNFLRQMTSTATFIHNHLAHVEFWGYSRIDNGGSSDVMPLLTGRNASELLGELKLDNYPFIWKHFKQAGYSTSLGEDSKEFGLFNQKWLGFNQPPTDYYLRPALVEMVRSSFRFSNKQSIKCTGNRTNAHVLHEFIEQMLPLMQRHKFFSLFWWHSGLKTIFNYGQHLDKLFLQMFHKFQATGILNNTLIILMSMHGQMQCRFCDTNQGKLEMSQPLLNIIYPKWLSRRYPRAIHNLKSNARSLTNAYDVNAFLMDLLNLNKLKASELIKRQKQSQKYMSRAISLLLPIPGERTCESAAIPASVCLCHPLEVMSISDWRVRRAARYTIKAINALISGYSKCQKLHTSDIVKAEIDWSNSTSKQSPFVVHVQLQTMPGHGVFRAAMRFDDFTVSLVGAILRLSKLNKECTPDKEINNFCYCT